MRENLIKIRAAIDGERAYQDVLEVTNFHRIQASPGFHAAAEHVAGKLRAEGIDCEVLSFPANEHTWNWANRSFQEWECRDGWCELVSPHREKLADFRANNISVIQKSFPCDYSDTPLDVVLMDKGTDEAAYEGVDLQGKLLFLHEPFQPYMSWAFHKRGAVGIISDFMREVPGIRSRADLYDARNYTSFWWKDTAIEPHLFGFVLTPRQGDALTALCRTMAAEHAADPSKPAYPQVCCRMDTRLYDGAMEVVQARLPGESEEEILVVAHLCHPRACANDNASGVSCAMETMRVLRELTGSGKLPPLKRGVRMLLVPEMHGTAAWLANHEHELGKLKAGINLDMVGGRQSKGYGPLTLCGQPHANPSLVTDAAAYCLDVAGENIPALTSGTTVPLFNSAVAPFTSGSDHLLFSDPSVNVPMPMLGQWPDLCYHTSADTVECVDPFMLKCSATTAACFAYLLSNLESRDVPGVFTRMLERCATELGHCVNRELEGKEELEKTFAWLEDTERFYRDTCADAKNYFEAAEYERSVRGQVERYQSLVSCLFESSRSAILCALGREDYVYERQAMEDERYDYVPVRAVRGYIINLDDKAMGNAELKEAYDAYRALLLSRRDPDWMDLLETYTLFYMDGRRTLNEIAYLAALENGGGDVEVVDAYVKLLIRYGLVTLAE